MNNIPENILQAVADAAFNSTGFGSLIANESHIDFPHQGSIRRAVIQHALENPALAPFLAGGIGEYTDKEIIEAWNKSNTSLPFMTELKSFLAALPRRESQSQAAAIAALKTELEQTRLEYSEMKRLRDKALAELAAAHSVLDGDPSAIIRNAAQGYPEGRDPRELTLAERVQALCKYSADYVDWHKKAEAELAALPRLESQPSVPTQTTMARIIIAAYKDIHPTV